MAPNAHAGAAVLACAVALSACGSGTPGSSTQVPGPFLLTPRTFATGLARHGVQVAPTRRRVSEAARSLPLPRSSETLRTAGDSRFDALFYRSAEVALRARTSVAQALAVAPPPRLVENVLIVTRRRGDDARRLSRALDALRTPVF